MSLKVEETDRAVYNLNIIKTAWSIARESFGTPNLGSVLIG